ncbi:MAG: hypothetical protein B6U65_03075 [Candidatus Wolframiiraptor sp. EX4484-121]|nr:MAG: hypothetical protein B6U65_03075 [Candidatus Wolframiiraptor sp. EX4484-121]
MKMERNELLEEFFMDLQKAIGRTLKIERKLNVDDIKNLVSVDAAYRGELMAVAAVKWNLRRGGAVDEKTMTCKPPYPYVPGLLFLREGPPMLRLVKEFDDWQLLLVDAHGALHPRRMGLAVFLGFILGKPAIGFAKSLLVGEEEPGESSGRVFIGGEALGYWFKPKNSRKFYVSPGYMVEVDQIPEIVSILGSRYPEALRRADILSRKVLRELAKQP